MAQQVRQELQGLILSRQQRETSQGVELLLWIVTDAGPCRVAITQQRYVFLLLQKDLQQAQLLWSEKRLARYMRFDLSR